MPHITWTNDLSVNINSIDAEHKKLIALINDLNDAMASGKGQTVIGEVLNELITYASTHFATEEKLMTAHAYPEYPAHKKTHDEFTQKVNIFSQDFKSGKLVVTVLVMQFLKDWLIKHIKGIDHRYGPFLVDKGVS